MLDRIIGRDKLRVENERLRRELRTAHGLIATGPESAAPSHGGPRSEVVRRHALERFQAIAAALAGQDDLRATLRFIVSNILEITGGQRGFLILRDDGELRFQTALHRDGRDLPPEPFTLSRTIAEEVAREGRPIVTGGAVADGRLEAIESVQTLEIASVLCLPIRAGSGPIGSVYVDDRRDQAFVRVDTDLAQAFVDLAGIAIERLRAEERRRREERLASLGQAVSFVLHDLAGPLQIIGLRAKLAARKLDPEHAGLLDAVTEQCARIDGMARDILDYSRGSIGLARDPVVVAGLVDGVCTGLRDVVVERGIELAIAHGAPTDVTVAVDRDRLTRAVENLIRNATNVLPQGGKIRVSTRRGPAGAEISVADDGPGVPEADRARIFDPFVRGRKGGSGIGLAMTRQAVEAHGGTIAVGESEELGGAEFVIRLPIADEGVVS